MKEVSEALFTNDQPALNRLKERFLKNNRDDADEAIDPSTLQVILTLLDPNPENLSRFWTLFDQNPKKIADILQPARDLKKQSCDFFFQARQHKLDHKQNSVAAFLLDCYLHLYFRRLDQTSFNYYTSLEVEHLYFKTQAEEAALLATDKSAPVNGLLPSFDPHNRWAGFQSALLKSHHGLLKKAPTPPRVITHDSGHTTTVYTLTACPMMAQLCATNASLERVKNAEVQKAMQEMSNQLNKDLEALNTERWNAFDNDTTVNQVLAKQNKILGMLYELEQLAYTFSSEQPPSIRDQLIAKTAFENSCSNKLYDNKKVTYLIAGIGFAILGAILALSIASTVAVITGAITVTYPIFLFPSLAFIGPKTAFAILASAIACGIAGATAIYLSEDDNTAKWQPGFFAVSQAIEAQISSFKATSEVLEKVTLSH